MRGGNQTTVYYSANPKDYKLLEEVGHGASATVYRAIYFPSNEVLAVKCLDLDRCNTNLDDMRRETQTMSLIDHPNVMKSYSSFVVDRNLWVIMPFMAEGSCLHLMKMAYPDGLNEDAISYILKQTLKALDYLHRQGHIHRDVKAGNILLDSNGLVKLGDFGITASLFETGDRQRARNTFVGTPCWMAPEVLQPGNGYNSKADIWSFGITALELAHGHAPFSKYPPMKVLLMTIQNAPPGLDYDRDKVFSKSFKEMVAICLVKDQTKRPTAEKLLTHSFFKRSKVSEVSVKKLLIDLPPLWTRVKELQLKDAAQLALKKMPSSEQEAVSQSEYQRGVSAWNFDVADLKSQASVILNDDDNLLTANWDEASMREGADSKVGYGAVVNGDQMAADCMNRKVKISEVEIIGSGLQSETGLVNNGSCIEAMESTLEQDGLQPQTTAKTRQTQSGPLVPGMVRSHSSSDKSRASERLEIESRSALQKVRKTPNFSGPLMLPNRASANSFSAPIKSSGGFRESLDDKSKANLVQIKGRFSVTSENLDLVKDMSLSTASRQSSQGASLRKSASIGDWIFESKQVPTSHPLNEFSSDGIPASLLIRHLQNLLQQTSVQQDNIMNLLNNLQSVEAKDASLNGKSPPPRRGSESYETVDSVASEREQLLLNKIFELHARLNDVTEELDAEKVKYSQLENHLKSMNRLG